MKNNIFKKFIIWSLICSLALEACPVWALKKDETLYVKLNNDGSESKIIDSIHLHNDSQNILKDKTNLNNIVNVNGNEKFKQNGNELIWEANGNDIYYQGTTTERMPISLNIKYYLNNEERDVNDIIGEKGNIKIVMKFQNNLKNTIKLNNQLTTLYTPFVIASTTIIPNTNSKNIKVTNGKIIDNGLNSIVVALASPGLYDSLKINSLKGMDEITISYDTESFELSAIYSVATSKIIEEEDFDIFNNLNGLYNSINTLSSSSKELVKGSNELLLGSKKLKDGSKELKDGINSALIGSQTINNLVQKSIEQLGNDKSQALDDDTLNMIMQKAIAGATLNELQQKQIGNNAKATVQSSQEYKKLSVEYNKYQVNINNLKIAYENALKENNQEVATKYLEQLNLATQMATTYKTMMTLMEETAYKTAINTANYISKNVAQEVSKSVAKEVANNAKEKFTGETTNSLKTLNDGLMTLNGGLVKLNEGAKILYDGTNSLNDGLNTLNQGMQKFDSQGINKITTIVNKDVKGLDMKLQKLAELSQEYKTFDAINNNDDGSSKIIMIVDSIKKEEKTVNETIIVEDNKNFWQKIKGLFK